MRKSAYVQTPPERRPLKNFAFDPMLGRAAGNRITVEINNEPVEINNEPLRPGPQGSRIEVIDYDGANAHYYMPVDLEDKNILMQGGLEPYTHLAAGRRCFDPKEKLYEIKGGKAVW